MLAQRPDVRRSASSVQGLHSHSGLLLPCFLQTDLLSMCLAVTLQLTLLCTGGSGGAPCPWAVLQWTTVLVPLALMLGWRTA